MIHSIFRFTLLLSVLVQADPACAGTDIDTPRVKHGSIHVHRMQSRFVDARSILVWLPEGYDPVKRYPVLYIHDAQNLFDSTITWNGLEWTVDETAGLLMRAGAIRECIIVGVPHNNAKRRAEYFIEDSFDDITEPDRSLLLDMMPGGPIGNRYLRFLVEEVKPFVDGTYATLQDQANTYVMGSSMGGLASLYAICKYPKVFGAAACVSTHWIGRSGNNTAIPNAVLDWVSQKLPSPDSQRIYFDHGSRGQDQFYRPFQKRMDELMRVHGYSRSNWITRHFPGADHNEASWSERLDIPLRFLLSK